MHDSIVVNVYLQDGLHAGQFDRWMRCRHSLLYRLDPQLELRDPLAEEKEWACGLRCVSHSASSAIKWGLAPFMSSDLLDDVAIAIMSLQNSGSELLKVAPMFVRTRVVFEQGGEDLADRAALWKALGVPDKAMEFILSVNPRWLPDRQLLSVSQSLQERMDAAACVERCLLVSAGGGSGA